MWSQGFRSKMTCVPDHAVKCISYCYCGHTHKSCDGPVLVGPSPDGVALTLLCLLKSWQFVVYKTSAFELHKMMDPFQGEG